MQRTTLLLLFSLVPAPVSAQAATGRWSVELWLDSAGAIGPRPTARYVEGQAAFDTLHTDTGAAPDGQHWTHQYWPGRYAIDLRPLFGTQIGRDVSTSVIGPFDSTMKSEVETDYPMADSVEMNFVPRVSHGGITAVGRIRGDTIVGTWYMRAYCCGAQGRFRMVRFSREPIPFLRPAPPPPPLPLPPDRRVEVRVRVRDLATGEFFPARHSVTQLTPRSNKCCYSTGTEGNGWGVYFWLPPGRYQIELDRFDCNGRFAALRRPVVHEFTGAAADTVQVTLEVNRDTVALTPTYDNRTGATCRELRGGKINGGA